MGVIGILGFGGVEGRCLRTSAGFRACGVSSFGGFRGFRVTVFSGLGLERS